MSSEQEYTVHFSEEEWKLLEVDLIFTSKVAKDAGLSRTAKGAKSRSKWLRDMREG